MSRIVSLTGKEFHDTLERKETRFEVIQEGPWTPGVDYQNRYIILREKKTGDTFMGFEAMIRIYSDVWEEQQNSPETQYTMRQVEWVGNGGWREMI